MFIVIEEENEETCEHKVVNETNRVHVNYCQDVVGNPLLHQRLCINDHMLQTCKSGQSNRFTWDSLLHHKVLKLSFTAKGSNSIEEGEVLEMINLS